MHDFKCGQIASDIIESYKAVAKSHGGRGRGFSYALAAVLHTVAASLA